MNRTSRNRFVAWLGIAAMWLAIVAPVISQSIAAREPQASICSVDALSSLVAGGSSHHHQAQDADHFDACSYCGLLAHHLPLASAAPAPLLRVERVVRVAARQTRVAVHTKSFNAAHPRAPPLVS